MTDEKKDSKPKKQFRPRRRKNKPAAVPISSDVSASLPTVDQAPESLSQPSAKQSDSKINGHKQRTRRIHTSNMRRNDLGGEIRTEIRRGYECMICMSEIKFYQSVWPCKTCYKLFHMSCTHEWIRRNTPKTKSPSEPFEWRCPGCQYVYLEPALPKFKCFCGRLDNPTPSRQSPFSCGDPCSVTRPSCGHPCVLTCHPGGCPPCTVLLPKLSCFCGRDPADGSRVRCGDPRAATHSCGSTCGRVLDCGLHVCESLCHERCSSCTQIVGSVKCYCGSESRNILCGQQANKEMMIYPFSCGKNEPVMMDCGKHRFLRKCGDSANRDCPLLKLKTCGCGSTPISLEQRTSCDEAIPTCNIKRSITLGCGHQAEIDCRLPTDLSPVDEINRSAAIECQAPITQFCRCSRTKRTVPCGQASREQFLCPQPCRTLQTCGKCKCDTSCCPDFGRRDYGAESHICYSICDKLLNCSIHKCDEIHHLGHCKRCSVVIREAISCGCGRTVLNPPFTCGTPLPPCFGVCNKELSCGHIDLSRCHSGQCAPCSILVSKQCAGGHQRLHQIPCFAQNIACNLKCGKALACGSHTDKAVCHSGPCQPCNQPCGSKLQFCEHECLSACGHPTIGCSKEPCKARIISACPCGLRTEEVVCRASELNPFPSPPTLTCSSECVIAQRQAVLRQAFKPEDIAEGEEAEEYSGELVALAEKNDKFVRLLDAILVDAAETRARTLNLAATDPIKRYLTLEYVQIHYRFEAEVLREGDSLHVCIHFVSGETRIPKPTLSALLDMMPSQTLKYIVDFAPDGPQIHLYDVARGYGRMTVERVNRELKEWVGSYRTRRGEGFNLFLDFFDGNKAVAAYRKLQSVHGLEQSRLLNVILASSPPPQLLTDDITVAKIEEATRADTTVAKIEEAAQAANTVAQIEEATQPDSMVAKIEEATQPDGTVAYIEYSRPPTKHTVVEIQ